ncbi:MAG: DUF1326 domain-containing protein, partial [Dehalococcoidia bacterium]
MAYRISGRATELCSCNAPCPCAFGQTPTGGTCQGMFVFDIEEGNSDGLSLTGTKAVLLAAFSGPWTQGKFTAALLLDSNDSQQQRDALQHIMSGQAGGQAAQLAALIGDFKGVSVAPFSYSYA